MSRRIRFRRPALRVAQWLRTTPGRLVAMTAALAVLALLAGTVGLVAVRQRSDRVSDVGTISGPLGAHALDIYRSLSDADATAATAFLNNGVESPTLRKRYQDDIARAGAALSLALRATDSQHDPHGRAEGRLRVVAVELPVYTGLVETARSFHRQQLPLGAAYLREASGLMRGTLLPAAQDLFTVETGRLVKAQRGAADFPVLVVFLGLVLLGGLIGTQIYLARRTNRIVNPGLAIATLATVVSIIWVTVAFASTVTHMDSGRRTGSTQFTLLAEARVAALQARADEALTLVARGDGAANERHFVLMLTRLIGKDGSSGLLGDARARSTSAAGRKVASDAATLARTWLARHRQVRKLDDGGQYADAVSMALSPGPDSSSTAFEQLDAALGKAVKSTNERFARLADDAGGNLDSALAGLVVPGLIVLAGAVLGTRKRIGEYR